MSYVSAINPEAPQSEVHVNASALESPQSICDVKVFNKERLPAPVKFQLENESTSMAEAGIVEEVESNEKKALLGEQASAKVQGKGIVMNVDGEKLTEESLFEQEDSTQTSSQEALAVEKESAEAQAKTKGAGAAAADTKSAKELQPKARTKAEKAAAVKAKNDLAAAPEEAEAKALEQKAFEDAKVCTGARE